MLNNKDEIMKKEINSEKIELNINNEKWEVKLVSFESDESPLRMLTYKNQLLVVPNNNYTALLITYSDESINIEKQAPNIGVSIKGNSILIYNR